MKDEYDFSRGERGKFHSEGAIFNLPIYLDNDNQSFVEQIAKRRNTDVSTVVNELIRSDKQLIKIMEKIG